MSGRGGVRPALVVAAVAAAYVAAAKFGFTLAFATKQVTAIWPPTGIALASLVLFGLRVWPGVALGAFVANVLTSETVGTALGITVGNTLGPLAGAYLLRRFRFDRTLTRVRDVVALAAVSLASMTVTATNGVTNLAAGGVIPWNAFGSVWWVWWIGDVLGALVVTPFLLAMVAAPSAARWELPRGRRLLELASLWLLLLGLGYLAFFARVLGPHARLEYAVFPLIIWSGLRFGPRNATTVVMAIAAFAISSAIRDRGPFAVGSQDLRLLLLDVFLAMSSFTALALSATTAEGRRARQELRLAGAELEQRVAQRTSELAAANSELERFAYAASHDLRAPLRAIIQLAEWITEEELARLGPQSQGYLTLLKGRAQRMETLLVDLLEYSRVGRVAPEVTTVDVGALLAEIAESAAQRGSFSTEIVEPMPVLTTCALPLRRVFMNLIDNAIKHHDRPRGSTRIAAAGAGPFIRFTVTDDGPGIPAQHHQRIFEMFQTLKPRDQVEGSGMGLSLVRKILESAGGEIGVESEGRGTTFWFTWPLAWPVRRPAARPAA